MALSLPPGLSRLSAALKEAPLEPNALQDWLAGVPEGGPACDIGGCGTSLTRAEALNGRCEHHRRAYMAAAGTLNCRRCEGRGWEIIEDSRGREFARPCPHAPEENLEFVGPEHERRLQHLRPEDIEPAGAVSYWSSGSAGALWGSEFVELRQHFEGRGDRPERAVQLAAVEVHRLKSVQRVGRALPPP